MNCDPNCEWKLNVAHKFPAGTFAAKYHQRQPSDISWPQPFVQPRNCIQSLFLTFHTSRGQWRHENAALTGKGNTQLWWHGASLNSLYWLFTSRPNWLVSPGNWRMRYVRYISLSPTCKTIKQFLPSSVQMGVANVIHLRRPTRLRVPLLSRWGIFTDSSASGRRIDYFCLVPWLIGVELNLPDVVTFYAGTRRVTSAESSASLFLSIQRSVSS